MCAAAVLVITPEILKIPGNQLTIQAAISWLGMTAGQKGSGIRWQRGTSNLQRIGEEIRGRGVRRSEAARSAKRFAKSW